jgi:hypothetical protein
MAPILRTLRHRPEETAALGQGASAEVAAAGGQKLSCFRRFGCDARFLALFFLLLSSFLQTLLYIIESPDHRKRPKFLSITHKLGSDHDSEFDVC